jgi:hypothetical protein
MLEQFHQVSAKITVSARALYYPRGALTWEKAGPKMRSGKI